MVVVLRFEVVVDNAQPENRESLANSVEGRNKAPPTTHASPQQE